MFLVPFRRTFQLRDPGLDVFDLDGLGRVIDDAFRGADSSGRWGRLVHHHFPERGNGRAGHPLQSRNGLPEGGSAGLAISLLELGFLLPAQQHGQAHRQPV